MRRKGMNRYSFSDIREIASQNNEPCFTRMYIERFNRSLQTWLTVYEYNSGTSLAQALHFRDSLFPNSRLVVWRGSEDRGDGITITYENGKNPVEKRVQRANTRFTCPECKHRLPQSISGVQKHFLERHKRALSPGEAHRIVTSLIDPNDYVHPGSDGYGKCWLEVSGGAPFSNRRRF